MPIDPISVQLDQTGNGTLTLPVRGEVSFSFRKADKNNADLMAYAYTGTTRCKMALCWHEDDEWRWHGHILLGGYSFRVTITSGINGGLLTLHDDQLQPYTGPYADKAEIDAIANAPPKVKRKRAS